MSDTDMQQTIQGLESRIAFQENTIAELSDQMALQANELETQKVHIQLLNKKLKTIMFEIEQGQFPESGDRPPHY